MIITGNPEVDERIKALHAAGQGHIFKYWDQLDDQERQDFTEEIMEIDIILMQQLIDRHVRRTADDDAGELQIEPSPITDREDDPRRAEARQAGENALRQGRVCAFLVAGGQGTRLGFDGPKGAFPVGPVSGRSLFQIHAEKIRAAAERYGVIIPWYIMTSKLNHAATIAFFEEQAYFGLGKDDVKFFSQSMIPAVDREGRFFLSSPGSLFRNPNGHGGSLEALHRGGALADMADRGIEYISYFQVDNCTVRVLDPVFIGFHILDGAQMSSKVVEKRDPEEKVGVIGFVGGRLGVIEYSDLPKEYKYARNADGGLTYSAGSIAIHILSRTFVEKQNEGGFRLPFHKALKKVPHLNAEGELVKPEEENGIKFETFVFDALLETTSSVTLRTRREDEFSPVKNAEGEDSPASASADMSALYATWLREAGMKGDLPETIEISPLFADTAHALAERLENGDTPGTLADRSDGGFLYT